MTKDEAKEDKNVLVVAQLPSQPVTSVVDKDGKQIELITIEEALTETLKGVREILQKIKKLA